MNKYTRRLAALAERLDHQVALIRNGGGDESQAGRLSEEAFAVRWALKQIDSEGEAEDQADAGGVDREAAE